MKKVTVEPKVHTAVNGKTQYWLKLTNGEEEHYVNVGIKTIKRTYELQGIPFNKETIKKKT